MKPLLPEVAALIPDGIENLELHCLVCTKTLPRSRRKLGTCPPDVSACQKVLTLYRRYSLTLTKCVACLHPSTPQERELFKQWRKASGQLRSKKGRPLGSKRTKIDNTPAG